MKKYCIDPQWECGREQLQTKGLPQSSGWQN